ncbi:hypothetical protein ACKVMY_21760 [Vibrio natriegens]|uniref:hypothetical protein n=1 Tax=Vibrio natriegens TaxID=691 RepID=UPI003DA018D2
MKQNATATAQGFIYQFYEAIEWCWKLKQGQKLYIESYGDISVSEDVNIEVKNVHGHLTDMGECFWKTLGNWLDDSFLESEYQALILVTTQTISSESLLLNWNKSNQEEKLNILKSIIDNDYESYKKKTEKYRANKSSDNKLKEPKLNKYVDKIRRNLNSKKLEEIVGKFKIMDSSPLFESRYRELCDIYGKGVLKRNVNSFINAQLGYVISPSSTNSNWEITYKDFANEVSLLTQRFATGSRIFPSPNQKNVDSREYQTYLFVTKISDINYTSEIDKACTDYANSMSIIDDSFSNGESKKRYDEYLVEVNSDFDRLYKKHSRRCSDEVDIDSQEFYDECHLFNPPVFSGYDSTQKSFRNGVLHIQMNDPNKKISWKLK